MVVSFIYQKTLKHTFEHKILNKIKGQLESKLKKENIQIKETIFIGFSYGHCHGTNIFYDSKKNEAKARMLNKILANHQVDIRCFSNLIMEYDIEILLGYIDEKNEKKYIKNIVSTIIESIYKTFSIFEKGVYISA